MIVIGSVMVGIIAQILTDGLTNGMLYQMLFNQISSSIAHIQIHKSGFNDNKVIQNYIPDYRKVEEAIKENPNIKYYSKRVITFGLLSSAKSSSGVYIYGVEAGREENVSKIKSSIIKGTYLTGDKREIVLGKRLADKLGVKLGDKVVGLANTPDGSIGSELFRITGFYETFSSEFDKSSIFINIASAQNMLNIGDNIFEFALITNNYKEASIVKDQISSKLSGQYEVLDYQDLLPLLIMQLDLYQEMMWILNLIIGLALIFGIINAMLMSVFERIREFGVIMSIGMKNSKLFLMVLLEALIIGVIGTILGIFAGILIHIPLSISGIDFSIFSESLKSFGVGAIIYPVLSLGNTISLIIIIPFIAALGAIYPAYKAVKLEPIYAIRYV